MDGWAVGAGVVEFPDGRRVRGRALRRAVPDGLAPTFGVYLARAVPAPPWDHVAIAWPDFRLPRDPAAALDALRDAFERARCERVEVACGGGIGRTGTALAVMAVLAGIAPDEAVDWVRARYHRRAVETPWQRRWVEHLAG